jgi:hypothetical protein
MIQEEKTKLITEVEKLKTESIQLLRNEDSCSPMYYFACGQSHAYVKIINLIEELF